MSSYEHFDDGWHEADAPWGGVLVAFVTVAVAFAAALLL